MAAAKRSAKQKAIPPHLESALSTRYARSIIAGEIPAGKLLLTAAKNHLVNIKDGYDEYAGVSKINLPFYFKESALRLSLDRVTAYAEAVIAGEIIAGKKNRLACQRHIDDLEHGPARGLYFDIDAADTFFEFCEGEHGLKLFEGQFYGKPFMLLGWQAFCTGSLYGWKVKETDYRRFKVAYIEAGKGSGKSPLAAAIGLYGMTLDGEQGAQIYAAASKRDQADILFRDAVRMVESSPTLAGHLKFSGRGLNVWRIMNEYSGSFFRPISSEDGKSGPRPYMALVDEVHEHKDDKIIMMLQAGFKGRKQPLLFMITNSGTDLTSICYDYHDFVTKIIEKIIDDPTTTDQTFGFILSIDDDDDPFNDESCWLKSNPSLGVTIDYDYIRLEVKTAKSMPSRQNGVLRLNFCRWTNAATAWIAKEVYEKVEKSFDPYQFKGEKICLGIDLSHKNDLTALSCFHAPSNSLWVYYFTPEGTLEDRAKIDRVPYLSWVEQGFLIKTPGNTIQFDYVAEQIKTLYNDFIIENLFYDRYAFKELENEFEDFSLPFVEHPQGFRKKYENKEPLPLWMPGSITKFEDRILEEKIVIQKNPVTKWNAFCAVFDTDPQGNRKFAKHKARGRIDGIVASAMAVGGNDLHISKDSVYEKRGMVWFN